MSPLIIYEKKFRLESKGWIAYRCPNCEKVQPFMCADNVRTEHLYYVLDVTEKKVGEVLTCGFCLMSLSLEKGTTIKVDPDWTPEDGLQVLADRTNPELGRIETDSGRTDAERRAVMRAVCAAASTLTTEAGPGMGLGALAGAGLGTLVGWGFHATGWSGYPQEDMFKPMVIAGAVGLALGALVGAWLWGRRRTRKLMRKVLREFMERHDLDPEKLWNAYCADSEGIQKIAPVLEAMRSERSSDSFDG